MYTCGKEPEVVLRNSLIGYCTKESEWATEGPADYYGQISLEETRQRRMSDAEEGPLGETEIDGEAEMEEEEDPNDNAEVGSVQQESEEDNTVAWRDSQEEGEEKETKEEAVREETVGKAGAAQEEVAAEVQEETTVKPQDVTESVVSSERLTLTDPQSVMSETSPVSSHCHSFIHNH